MVWSIVEVARMSGVTARTLRHYDEIGLLPPAFVGGNGYRMYGQEQLLRLQEVLVLRQLGLGLADIAAVLDEQADRVTALKAHLERLLAERERLEAVAATVARTIRDLEKDEGGTMATHRPEELFEGFDQSEYEKEAQERWPEQYASSKSYVDSLTPEDARRLQREWALQMQRMAALRDAGAPADDERVQTEIDGVYRGLTRMWTPNAAAFKNLGDMYVDDPRFTATYDRVSPGLAVYYRDAMHHYAEARLS